MNKIVNTDEFERCVVCGELTAVPVSMPIELREGYVVGCGQLCHFCNKTQAETESALSVEQILQAVEQSRINE